MNNVKTIFLHDWKENPNAQYQWDRGGLEELKSDFQIDDETLEGVEILFASYTYENYSGNAFVLFRKDGQYYEVNGGHCSCYGLEGQWEPEKTSLAAINYRLSGHYFGTYNGENEFAIELKDLLNKLTSYYNNEYIN